MEATYFRKQFTLYGNDCDCFGRVKPSTILGMMQEAAGEQCNGWNMSWDEMAAKGLFWAITRQTVSVTRLPRAYETITIETWPMPATRHRRGRQKRRKAGRLGRVFQARCLDQGLQDLRR